MDKITLEWISIRTRHLTRGLGHARAGNLIVSVVDTVRAEGWEAEAAAALARRAKYNTPWEVK